MSIDMLSTALMASARARSSRPPIPTSTSATSSSSALPTARRRRRSPSPSSIIVERDDDTHDIVDALHSAPFDADVVGMHRSATFSSSSSSSFVPTLIDTAVRAPPAQRRRSSNGDRMTKAAAVHMAMGNMSKEAASATTTIARCVENESLWNYASSLAFKLDASSSLSSSSSSLSHSHSHSTRGDERLPLSDLSNLIISSLYNPSSSSSMTSKVAQRSTQQSQPKSAPIHRPLAHSSSSSSSLDSLIVKEDQSISPSLTASISTQCTLAALSSTDDLTVPPLSLTSSCSASLPLTLKSSSDGSCMLDDEYVSSLSAPHEHDREPSSLDTTALSEVDQSQDEEVAKIEDECMGVDSSRVHASSTVPIGEHASNLYSSSLRNSSASPSSACSLALSPLPAGRSDSPRSSYLRSMDGSYAREILDHLLASEFKHLPRTHYIEQVQTDLSYLMRSILMDWLVEVSSEYGLSIQTLFLAVNYVDRFLSLCMIDRARLQLLGVACMLVASKYEESRPPSIDDFIYISDATYSRQQVLDMEAALLDVLGFALTAVTPWDIETRIGEQLGRDIFPQRTEFLTEMLMTLFILEPSYTHHRPSVIAVSAIFLALWTTNQSPWPPELAAACSFPVDSIDSCVRAMHSAYLRTCSNLPQPTGMAGSPLVPSGAAPILKAIREKYSRDALMNVATIQPPTYPPIL